MELEQIAVVTVLLGALVLFAWGYWRYDLVALVALLLLVVLGIVPQTDAFTGFGHPAVITVIAVLIISAALEKTGVVDIISAFILRNSPSAALSMLLQTGVVTVLSAFMNNIGALALMLPVALQVARRLKIHPGQFLMPLAFGSIIGGLLTMIGTPPNIIVAKIREDALGESFQIFDFTPVGLAVAASGVAVIAIIARFLLPAREEGRQESVYDRLEPYLTEIFIPESAALSGKPLRDLRQLGEDDVALVAMIRDGERTLRPHDLLHIRPDDTFIIEADPESLRTFLERSGAEITAERHFNSDLFTSDEILTAEIVILPGSRIERRTAAGLRLRAAHAINLLGISRQSGQIRSRLGHVRFRVGDVLLVQGDAEAISEACASLDCLPLERRGVTLRRRFSPIPILIFFAALATSTFGLLPIQISLSLAAVGVVIGNYLSMREAYDAIDWPVIVLLGAMVPVGATLETTGVTTLLSDTIIASIGGAPQALVVPLLMIIAIALSNVVNNAATAILMAPLAIGVAGGLGVNADAFLMAVAVGSSCAFLTPIGHQSNLLVMGPGGYAFGDYWRLGLPVSITAVVVGSPAILAVWPL